MASVIRDDNSAPETPSLNRDAAVAVVAQLQQAGFVAYLAGGCVRDELLGLQPKDYDVATDARPEQVKKIFRSARLVGESFGVALVRSMGCNIEVATFRKESGYTDGRHPDQVEFTDAKQDAQRRDFTVNGLFEDPLVNDPSIRIIDHIGGVDDLRAGVIRAIGDPHERFAEDYLRLLRAVRFTARLGFSLEPQTAAAITRQARYLSQISRERIGQEVLAMVSGPRPAVALNLIQQLRLDGPTLNEDHAEPALKFVQKLSPPCAAPVALAAWLLDRHLWTGMSQQDKAKNESRSSSCDENEARSSVTHLPELLEALDRLLMRELDRLVQRWRKALSLSNDHRDDLLGVIQGLVPALHWPGLSVARRKRLLAHRLWPQVHPLLGALSEVQGVAEVLTHIERDLPGLLAQGVAPEPVVTGDDLIAAGFQPGPKFKSWLDAVYDEQLEGRVIEKSQGLKWLRENL